MLYFPYIPNEWPNLNRVSALKPFLDRVAREARENEDPWRSRRVDCQLSPYRSDVINWSVLTPGRVSCTFVHRQ